jgi:hypothetical protein
MRPDTGIVLYSKLFHISCINNNKTLFNEDLQIKLQLVQLVSNLVLVSSRNILHHVITILMQLTYFRYVGYTVTDASQTHNIHRYITITQH